MAKLRINGDSSGYVDLEAPNAASSSTLDLDQVPQKNATTTGFTGNMGVGISTPSTTASGYDGGNLHVHNSGTGSSLRLTNSTTGTGTSSGMLISKWSDSNTYLTNFDDGASTIFTQSTSGGTLQTAMKLHGDGYVTKPQQPVFMARKSSTQSIVNSDKITFENAITNAGTHYNTTNSRFTAPVAGNYSFSINLRCGIESGARVLTIAIHKNGSVLYARFAGTGGVNDDGSGSYDHPYISGTIILPLNANDYIEMYFGTENSFSGNGLIQSSDNSSYFMGHLIG